jgi:3-oxoacyl-[acyl-carrier protein] reductase
MHLDLTGRTALVGGSSQGLGAAIAIELASLGANIFLLARNADKLEQVLQQLDTSRNQQHHFIVGDTQYPDAIVKEVSAFLSSGNHIDILVNNSGGPASGPLLETAAADLDLAFRSHLQTAHALTQLVVPGMKQAGFGRIVNVLSTSIKEPIEGLGISNSIRAAVANWAKTLSVELGAWGITVNNVLPGYTRTSRLEYLFGVQAERAGVSVNEIHERTIARIPARRLGEPAEFAAAVAFLCSPAAAYINGINLPVDGGRLGSL